ncbi:tetratricopeptide repeat-containing protein [Toxoplasma gondii CAST]|uniref:Tetratricopeptide repeat-containing protein n=1 Tax=Toxoplasma gondii CAST TaxID=943122 RepID=A0A3R7YTM4_TOXGO|nr:tetratricopeptide repeat-containing protein [Toxoplasma gondii CAST]
MEANASENSKLSESPVANAEESRVEDAAMSDSLSSVQTDDEKAKDEDEETVDGTPEERMTLALSCKDAGNDVFKSGDVSAAKAKYTVSRG